MFLQLLGALPPDRHQGRPWTPLQDFRPPQTRWVQKTNAVTVLKIYLFVSTECTNVTDG